MPEWKLTRFQNAVYLLSLKKRVEFEGGSSMYIDQFIHSIGTCFSLVPKSYTNKSSWHVQVVLTRKQERKKKNSMWSWKQTHIQRLPVMSPWHYVFGSGQFDLPITQMYHLNLLQFVCLGFNCSWRKAGGGTGVHLKDTKVNINSIFKRKLPPRLDGREGGQSHVEQNR